MSPVPLRTAICLDCRTALFDQEPCDQTGHRAVSLDDDTGYERLVTEVWGAADQRDERLRRYIRNQRARAGGGVAGFGVGAALGFSAIGTHPVSLLAGLVGMWLGSGGAAEVLPGDLPVPRGASDITPERRGPRGRAAGRNLLSAPASGTDCLAYALELRLEGPWGRSVVFRDAVTCGFEVELDSGETARIPAGRVRLHSEMRQLVDFDNAELDRFLRAVDGVGERGGFHDPLRYDVVAEALVIGGDPIELGAGFEPTLAGDGSEGGYRQAARTILAPRGTPAIRPLLDDA